MTHQTYQINTTRLTEMGEVTNMQTATLYQHYKNLHDSIKPIRGRNEDVRPIGERRRDWERVEMDGDVVACRLYNTQCVRYYPDGRIGLRTDGWETPSTSDFIHTHSPWQCFKRNNKLWIRVPSETEKYLYYPIPSKGEIQFRKEGNRWVPTEAVVVEKRKVNRDRAKEARAPYKPFLDWAKTFMKMSDGWIMHETRKQVMEFDPRKGFKFRTSDSRTILEMARSTDHEDWMRALSYMLWRNPDEQREAEVYEFEGDYMGKKITFTNRYMDQRYRFETLKRSIYKMIGDESDIYDRVQVEVGNSTMTNIV